MNPVVVLLLALGIHYLFYRNSLNLHCFWFILADFGLNI